MSLNIEKPNPLPAEKEDKDPLSLLLECGIESFVETWVAVLWGSIVFDVVGGVVGDMIPSAPPGMSPASSSHTHHEEHGGSGGDWIGPEDKVFWVVFAVFFILNVRTRLFGTAADGIKKETRLHRVARRLREEGFNLLLTNAFGAMIAAWMASIVTEFSWSQICLHWVFDMIAPLLNHGSDWLFGPTQTGAVRDWWSWWGDNQLKFSFWVFYITAICDDLGIPNFKTLGRFLYRRWRHRVAAPIPPPGRQAA